MAVYHVEIIFVLLLFQFNNHFGFWNNDRCSRFVRGDGTFQGGCFYGGTSGGDHLDRSCMTHNCSDRFHRIDRCNRLDRIDGYRRRAASNMRVHLALF